MHWWLLWPPALFKTTLILMSWWAGHKIFKDRDFLVFTLMRFWGQRNVSATINFSQNLRISWKTILWVSKTNSQCSNKSSSMTEFYLKSSTRENGIIGIALWKNISFVELSPPMISVALHKQLILPITQFQLEEHLICILICIIRSEAPA